MGVDAEKVSSRLRDEVLVPLVASIVFGMLASTVLMLVVLPASYAILEDLGFTEPGGESEGWLAEREGSPAA